MEKSSGFESGSYCTRLEKFGQEVYVGVLVGQEASWLVC